MARLHYCPTCLTTFPTAGPTCPNLNCGAASPDPWPTLLAEGDLLDRTYRITRRLAGGAAGMTYLAREIGDQDELVGPPLAIKVLYAQRDSGPFLRRLATEAQVLQGLQHPHIVQCLGFVHRAGRPPYLITRFEAGGTLIDHLARVGPLSPQVAAAAVSDLVDALDAAHRAGVVHRDLKPANVLLRAKVPAETVPNVKVADFGIAKVQGGVGSLTRVGAFVGTPEYAAPEQLLGLTAEAPADLFAAGGILWFLLTGQQPFRLTQRHDPAHTHTELLAQLPPRLPTRFTETPAGARVQMVLEGLLTADVAARWSADQVREALDAIRQSTPSSPLPRSTDPAPNSGGTLVSDEANTFIWGTSGTIVAPPEAEADPPAPVTPLNVDRLATPVLPAGNLTDADAWSTTPAPAQPRPAAAGSTMEGLFDFGASVDAPAPTATAGGAFDAAGEATAEAARTDAPPPTVEEPHFAPEVPLPTDPMALLAVVGRQEHDAATTERMATWHDDEVGPLLREARKHPDPDTRRGVLRALVLLDRPSQISLARTLLRDPIAEVRAQAARTIGAIGTGSAILWLKRLESDESPSVIEALAEAWKLARHREGTP